MLELMAADWYRATVWPVLNVQDHAQFTIDNGLPYALYEMRQNNELCDVTLHVQGQDFPAHKVVLSAASEYFRMMFTTNMKEKTSHRVDLTESIILDDVANFNMVLLYMYTGQIQMSLQDIEDFVRVADFLLLQELKDFCQEFYLRYLNLNLGNCLRVGAIADRHHLDQVRAVSRNMLCSRFHDHIAFGEEFLDLPESAVSNVLRDTILTKFMSPDDMIRCVLRWIQKDESRATALTSLLQCVPLSNMTVLNLGTLESLLLAPEISNDTPLLSRLQQLYRKAKRQSLGRASPPTLRPRRSLCYSTSKSPGPSRDISVPGGCVTTGVKRSEDVLICVNTNPFLKYIKVLLYHVDRGKWYNVTMNVASLLNDIPGTQTVGASTLHNNKLYLFVSYFIPFPQNLQGPIMLEYDILTGERRQLVFQCAVGQVPGCETSIVDLKSLPPVFLCQGDLLYLVANVNAMGCLYVCNINTLQYEFYQIPNSRFISKARAVLRDGRYLYIWCRHRFGNEDVHFHSAVSFVIYDTFNRHFLPGDFPPPPAVGYAEFENAHVLCVQDSAVVVHSPGRASYRLDEATRSWVPEPLTLPGFPRHRESPEMGYHGHVLYMACGGHTFLLQNPAVYTTSLCCLTPGQQTATCLRPPPLDGVGVVTSGTLPDTALLRLTECTRFDLSYTEAIMNPDGHPNCDSDSGDDRSEQNLPENDDNDGFLFDDEIYGFNDG